MSKPEPGSRLPISRVLSHLAVMGAVAVVMGVITAGLTIPFAAVAGLGARDVSDTLEQLPSDLEPGALAQKTTVLDVRGRPIASFYDENRVAVPLKDMSRTMVKAIVSIEDYRFYQHGALDVKGTLRALVTNQASSGVVQGGSSITQQMVKLTLLSQADTPQERKAATDDTYARKLRELRYAIAFEHNYSKDWILERYLNIAYFGDGAFGIQSAARHYFDKNASRLNLTESAMLAGLVKNPTGYDPTNDPEAAMTRRNVVLDRMAELNVITPQHAKKAKASPLGLHVKAARNGCVESDAQFFCDYLRNYLLQDPQLGRTVDERMKLLTSGGLTIHTTVDQKFQRAADASVANHVSPTDGAIGGLAEVVPGTGEVRALAQSRPMGRNANDGETFLNYVVPRKYGDANGFQAGSTFKAFVLAAAIGQNLPLSTSFSSPPVKVMPFSAYKDCDGNPLLGGVWTVHNSTDSGTMNMYSGTQRSVNTYFAQLEAKTGVCAPYKLAKKMGIHLTDPTNNMVPTFTLGVTDTDPLSMSAAYATFAARGTFCTPTPVTKIEDANGNLIKNYGHDCRRVMTADTADAVNDILKGVQEPGGFGGDAGLGLTVPSAGKTGTTNSNQAVWFVGYTPALSTASMIAGANSQGHWVSLEGQTLAGNYVYSAHGSTTAGPMWGDAMHAIQGLLPNEAFVRPSPEEISGVQITVPDISGMSLEEAKSTLSAAGFEPVEGGYVDSSYSRGTASYSYPSGGSTYGSGAEVTIYLSDGTPYVPPPPNNGPKNGGKNGGKNNDGGGNTGGNTGDSTPGGNTGGNTGQGNGNG